VHGHGARNDKCIDELETFADHSSFVVVEARLTDAMKAARSVATSTISTDTRHCLTLVDICMILHHDQETKKN